MRVPVLEVDDTSLTNVRGYHGSTCTSLRSGTSPKYDRVVALV